MTIPFRPRRKNFPAKNSKKNKILVNEWNPLSVKIIIFYDGCLGTCAAHVITFDKQQRKQPCDHFRKSWLMKQANMISRIDWMSQPYKSVKIL